MKFLLVCDSKNAFCGSAVWIRGHTEYDTNATVLDDNDSRWETACVHIRSGDYYIKDSEVDDENE